MEEAARVEEAGGDESDSTISDPESAQKSRTPAAAKGGRAGRRSKRSRRQSKSPSKEAVAAPPVEHDDTTRRRLQNAQLARREHVQLGMRAPEARLRSARTLTNKRLRWTPLEASAVRRGVEEFGDGNWVEIHLKYRKVLWRRSTVDIKVRRPFRPAAAARDPCPCPPPTATRHCTPPHAP